jgi:hypothetical protein
VEPIWESVLRQEFDAEPGSFLIRLRADLEWDGPAFERLATAMESCCRDTAGDDQRERWLAEGFWYLDTFTSSWTRHPSWEGRPDLAEIEAGRERLSGLAYWFFTGESPYESDPASQGS